MNDLGPFASRLEATVSGPVEAVYDAVSDAGSPAEFVAEIEAANWQLLTEACTAARLELGRFDHEVVLRLAANEPEVCGVVAALIHRAAAAGLAERLGGVR